MYKRQLKKIGDRVEQGEPLAMLHTNDWHSLEPAAKLVMSSYEISEDKCNPPCLLYTSWKERIIPMGSVACFWVETYLQSSRGRMLQGRREKALFVNARGKRLTRQGFWKIIKGYAKKCGISKPVTPHILRHCFALSLIHI